MLWSDGSLGRQDDGVAARKFGDVTQRRMNLDVRVEINDVVPALVQELSQKHGFDGRCQLCYVVNPGEPADFI